MFRLDYGDNFSPVSKIALVHQPFSVANINHRPLNQQDIKNAFLYRDVE